MTIPRLRGSVIAAAPDASSTRLLVLLPSLGTSTEVWDGVVAVLTKQHRDLRILRVDLPGHGATPATLAPFTVAELAAATLRVIDEIGGGRFHLAGISLGGEVALELAATSERVLDVALFCTGSRIGTPESWAERQAQVRALGTASIVAGSASRWFAPGYLEANPDGPGGAMLRTLVDIDDESYILCCEALATFDRTTSLPELRVPVVAVAGEFDAVATPESLQALAAAVPGGRFVKLDGTSHLAVAEDPEAAAAVISQLLTAANEEAPSGTADSRGMRTRRAVLGDAHVDRAIANTTPETAAFQDFITRYAWGEVWSRDELSRRDRSIATLASLVTGGHGPEVRMHVRAALGNGLTPTEITEVIMHTAVYAGLPAANEAMAIAREVFADDGADGAPAESADGDG